MINLNTHWPPPTIYGAFSSIDYYPKDVLKYLLNPFLGFSLRTLQKGIFGD